jgi:hypothetical protein
LPADDVVHVDAALGHVLLIPGEAKENVRVRQPALLELHHRNDVLALPRKALLGFEKRALVEVPNHLLLL